MGRHIWITEDAETAEITVIAGQPKDSKVENYPHAWNGTLADGEPVYVTLTPPQNKVFGQLNIGQGSRIKLQSGGKAPRGKSNLIIWLDGSGDPVFSMGEFLTSAQEGGDFKKPQVSKPPPPTPTPRKVISSPPPKLLLAEVLDNLAEWMGWSYGALSRAGVPSPDRQHVLAMIIPMEKNPELRHQLYTTKPPPLISVMDKCKIEKEGVPLEGATAPKVVSGKTPEQIAEAVRKREEEEADMPRLHLLKELAPLVKELKDKPEKPTSLIDMIANVNSKLMPYKSKKTGEAIKYELDTLTLEQLTALAPVVRYEYEGSIKQGKKDEKLHT